MLLFLPFTFKDILVISCDIRILPLKAVVLVTIAQYKARQVFLQGAVLLDTLATHQGSSLVW